MMIVLIGTAVRMSHLQVTVILVGREASLFITACSSRSKSV